MLQAVWLIFVGGAALLAAMPSAAKPLGGGAIAAIALGFLFGPLSALWGLWGLVGSTLNVAWVVKWPIVWVTYLVTSVTQTSTGAVLSVRAIQLVGDLKLPPIRDLLRVLGATTIACGVWSFVSALLFRAES